MYIHEITNKEKAIEYITFSRNLFNREDVPGTKSLFSCFVIAEHYHKFQKTYFPNQISDFEILKALFEVEWRHQDLFPGLVKTDIQIEYSPNHTKVKDPRDSKFLNMPFPAPSSCMWISNTEDPERHLYAIYSNSKPPELDDVEECIIPHDQNINIFSIR